jgi:serine/threonine-protein kinase
MTLVELGGALASRRRSRPRVAKRSLVALLLVSVLGTVAPARAQTTTNSAAAQGLFDQAKELMDAGKFAEACPKLEESQRLDPASGTLLNLARCYEKSGRTASAWSTYLDAAAAAKAGGNAEREQAARAKAKELAPAVSRLVIDVPESVRLDGLEITRDGAEIGAAQWGAPIPLDDGAHEVRARAPGHAGFETKVTLTGPAGHATVSIPKLAEQAASGAAAGSAAAEGAAPSDSASSSSASDVAQAGHSGLGTQRTVALVTGGAGIVGLAVGGVFGLQAISKHATAKKDCVDTVCASYAGATAGNDAHAAGNVATISMIAGGVLLASGAVLWFTAPHPGAGRAQSAIPRVGLGLGHVEIRGAF